MLLLFQQCSSARSCLLNAFPRAVIRLTAADVEVKMSSTPLRPRGSVRPWHGIRLGSGETPAARCITHPSPPLSRALRRACMCVFWSVNHGCAPAAAQGAEGPDRPSHVVFSFYSGGPRCTADSAQGLPIL